MQNIIEIKNLTKKFGPITAVNDISLEVKKGEIFAFLGPNGAGKSTTIKIITTLLHYDVGEIRINGHDPKKDPDDVRKSVGIVFQDPSLDDELTAQENMEFHALLYKIPKPDRAQKIENLLKLVDLNDRSKDFVRTFSGGMKRRLEIARALLHEPAVLFLDEPTLGLDPQTRNHIWSYVKDLNEKSGMTVFFTTHYMDEASKMAERIAIIDAGKIIDVNTPEQIVAKAGTSNLEEAFIKLTGHQIRDEGAGTLDAFRRMARVWGGRK